MALRTRIGIEKEKIRPTQNGTGWTALLTRLIGGVVGYGVRYWTLDIGVTHATLDMVRVRLRE